MNTVAIKSKSQDSIPVNLGMSFNLQAGDIMEDIRVDDGILFKVKQAVPPQQALADVVEDESSNLSLQERLIELENQGIWVAAKDPDTRLTLGEPALGALERFLVHR